ncbi:uncharacterized protein METZ01_LOCUS422786 [marine metagenome]|uniref:Uncharacterized protein n=1 Tax=marine metagenome TaxID=408172 RepID=A0A382XFU9_9ZZZZ
MRARHPVAQFEPDLQGTGTVTRLLRLWLVGFIQNSGELVGIKNSRSSKSG